MKLLLSSVKPSESSWTFMSHNLVTKRILFACRSRFLRGQKPLFFKAFSTGTGHPPLSISLPLLLPLSNYGWCIYIVQMAVAKRDPDAETHRLPGTDSTSSLHIEQIRRYVSSALTQFSRLAEPFPNQVAGADDPLSAGSR